MSAKTLIPAMLSKHMRRLSRVFRYGSFHVQRMESVAEHSYFVAMYAYCIGTDLQKYGVSIDVGKTVLMAIMHDIEEAHTGDLVHPTKVANPALRDELEKVAESYVAKMQEAVGVGFMKHWSAQSVSTIEAAVMKLADSFAVTAFLIEEIKMGNKYMCTHMKEHIGYLLEHLKVDGMGGKYPMLLPYIKEAIQLANSVLD